MGRPAVSHTAREESAGYRQSHFERRNDAVWLREPEKGNPTTSAQGEVAHIHPSDGSMHMTLSPSDTAKVIGSGWGELHGLAGVNGRLPATYTMIYAPRNAKEVAVVDQILQAAVKYALSRSRENGLREGLRHVRQVHKLRRWVLRTGCA